MFSLTKESLRLADVNPRKEIHGDEKVLAVDLKLEFETANAVLLKFSPTLRDALYTQDPSATKDMINPDHAPVLRNPQMGEIKWALEIPSVRFSVFVDGTNDEDIIFVGAKCNNFKFTCKEGGTVLLTFRIQMSEPLEVDVTKLLFLMDKSIKVSLVEDEEEEDEEDNDSSGAERPDNVVGLFDNQGAESNDGDIVDADFFPSEGAQTEQPQSADAEEPAGDETDPLYANAVAFVRELNKASISMVQRNLKVGYNRAARMLEQMEKDGVVSTPDASGKREVLTQAA